MSRGVEVAVGTRRRMSPPLACSGRHPHARWSEAKTMTPEKVREAERASMATDKKRFDQELLGLKRLVEASR